MNMDQYNHYYYLKRFFLLWSFVCLIIEIESTFLFLWPLNYSCAKPSNLRNNLNISKVDIDSAGQTINPEAIQINLADANTDDPITTARGLSMGYNYDDIEHCLEHPIEYNDSKAGDFTIDMNNLEPCRYGLRFELIPDHNLSVIAHFQLACSRQWLKPLLYQSMCFGILIGLIIPFWLSLKQPFEGMILCYREEYSNSTTKHRSNYEREIQKPSRELIFWCLIQVMLILVAKLSGHSLASYSYTKSSVSVENPNTHYDLRIDYNTSNQELSDYLFLLLSVFSRSIIIFSNLSRILRNWTLESPSNVIDFSRSAQQLFENHLNVVSFIAIYIAFEALYLPIVVRIFHHWYDLNKFLTNLASIHVVLATIYELLFLRMEFSNKILYLCENSLSRWSYFKGDNPILSGEDNVYIKDSDSIKTSTDEATECISMNTNTSGKRWRHIEYHGFTIINNEPPDPSPPPPPPPLYLQFPVKVCEFCMIAPEQTAYSAKEGIATPNNINTTAISTPMNHHHHNSNNDRHHYHSRDKQRRQNNSHNDTIMMKLNDSSVVDFDPYRPTTVSNDSLINNENYNYNNTNDHDDQNYKDKNSNLDIMPTNAISSLSLVTKQTMSQPSCSSEYTSSSPFSAPLSSPYPQHFEPPPPLPPPPPTPPFPPSLSVSRLNKHLSSTKNSTQAMHDFGRMYADLFRSPLIIKLNLLTFCLSFNFFLLRLIPNHEMIHSESIASKYARKVNHHNTLVLSPSSPFTHRLVNNSKIEWSHNDHKVLSKNSNDSYEIKNNVTNHWFNQHNFNNSNDKMKTNNTINRKKLIDERLAMNESVLLKQHLFDYGDINHAFVAFNSLYDSYNPFKIIGTTIGLNQWPITLFVFLIHTSKLSSFESTYFNPKRLFILAQIGSQLLVIEWILIG